jgi:hypothetical protein
MPKEKKQRRLILHIGTEKTGSTSIQVFLRINQKRLAEGGVGVPSELGDTLHFRLQLLANDEDFNDDFIMNLKLHLNKELRAKTLSEWRNQLYQEVESSVAQTWIISCETLHSRLLKDSELVRLKKILSPLFDRIDVLVYLREPLSMVTSRLTENAKSAIPVVIPEPVANQEFDIADHQATLQRWESAMGPGKLIVRIFESESLVGGNVINDFIEACGLEQENYLIPRHQNPSLSRYGLKLTEEINRHVPRRWIDGTLIKSRWQLMCHIMLQLRGGVSYIPSPEDIKKYDQFYEERNEWVRCNYFPEKEKLFKKTWQASLLTNKAEEEATNLARTAQLIANIWLTKTAQVNQLEAQVAYLKDCLKTQNPKLNIDDLQKSGPSHCWQDYLER